MDLFYSSSILISSKTLLASTRLDIIKKLRKEFVFIISLLDTTIQDGSMKERSDNESI